MRRLTYKLDDPLETKYLHYDYMKIADYDISKGNFGRITDVEVYNKLGQLEDLEEELGIDLLTLFKALKDGVWISIDNVFFNKLIYKSSSELSLKFYLGKWYICYYNSLNKGVFYLDLKGFNKTWWLEKPKENEND